MVNLKQLRGTLSQEKLAKALGITQRTYSNYENALREPDYETLKKIATYFNVSIDYLLGHEKRQLDNILSANTIISTSKSEVQALYDAMSQQQQNLLIAYGKGLLADSGIDFTKLA